MKRAMQLLLAIGAAWLFALAMGTLVEGPERMEAEPPPPMAAQVAMLTEQQPCQQTAQVAVETIRRRLPDTAMQSGSVLRVRQVSPMCDRNGYPVGREAYIRTVYQAFPPERLAG